LSKLQPLESIIPASNSISNTADPALFQPMEIRAAQTYGPNIYQCLPRAGHGQGLIVQADVRRGVQARDLHALSRILAMASIFERAATDSSRHRNTPTDTSHRPAETMK
jgi:hypothetical protein